MKRVLALFLCLSICFVSVMPCKAVEREKTKIVRAVVTEMQFTYNSPEDYDPFVEGEIVEDAHYRIKGKLLLHCDFYYSDGYVNKDCVYTYDIDDEFGRKWNYGDTSYHLRTSDTSIHLDLLRCKRCVYIKDSTSHPFLEDYCYNEEWEHNLDGTHYLLVEGLADSYSYDIPIKVVSKDAPLNVKYPINKPTNIVCKRIAKSKEAYYTKKHKIKYRYVYTENFTWKNAKGICDYYEVQVSKSKSFKKSSIYSVGREEVGEYSVGGLKKGKYYVRVRAVRWVSANNENTCYLRSNWVTKQFSVK